MTLASLLYASTARPGIGAADIEAIVATARTVNAALDVTGLLAFDGKAFAQILEGDETTVRTLYDRIARDHRHSGCILLSFGPIRARKFEGWSMAYRKLSDLIMIQDVEG